MKKIIYSLLTLILLASCSTDPSSLKQKGDVRYFEIKKAVVDGRDPAVERTLYPCIYNSIGSNSSGTYFMGVGKCVGVHIVDRTNNYFYTYKGGVWVPKSKNKNPKLFVINGSHLDTAQKAPNVNVKVVDTAQPNSNPAANALGGAVSSAVLNSMLQAEIGNIQPVSEIIDEETISLIRNSIQ